MKFAVVINVGSGSEALEFALKTQGLLLEHVGEKLDSIRLAVPRLLQLACVGAIAEAPDVLVVAGGPRTARRAGQIAYKQGVPILFLPGLRSAIWAKPLWGSLPLEAMISALAREDVRPSRMAVGMAGDQIFFGDARCGLLPQLAEVHSSFFESKTIAESWRSWGRVASLAQSMAHPAVRVCSGQHDVRASALIVTAQDGRLSPSRSAAQPQSFSCTVWKHRNLAGYMAAALKAATGADWRLAADCERFECDSLTIDMQAAPWIVLDGDPVGCTGPVDFRFLPDAMRTCVFRIEHQDSDCDSQVRTPLSRLWNNRSQNSWNDPWSSHVAMSKNRMSGRQKEVQPC